MRQYAAALEGVKAQAKQHRGSAHRSGIIQRVVRLLLPIARISRPETHTQVMRRNITEKFRLAHGTKPLKGLGVAHIKDIMGAKADTPEAANNLLKVLRVILGYAVSVGLIASNPATGVKKYRSRGEGFHTWSEDEIAQFEDRHRNRFAHAACLCSSVVHGTTSLRRGANGLAACARRRLAVRQEKTGTALLIPVHPELATALASVPRTNLTFLMTEKGAPFTSAGFGNWFRDQCDLAGLPQCTAHGLRKAAATRLANAGCSSDQIKAITGHKSLSEVAHYTRAADQQRLARQALKIQLGAESEQKLSNLPTRLDKTWGK